MALEIRTNLDPDEIHDELLVTWQKWVQFSLGDASIGGRILRYPSGRYASAISAKRDSAGRIVGLYVDPSSPGAKIARFVEYGHKAFSLKDKMLRKATGGKRGSGGYLYRRLNLRQSPRFSPLDILAGGKSSSFNKTGPLRLNKRMGKIWAANYKNYGNNFRTMSNKPGSAAWVVPAMPAYNAARLLKEQMRPELRDRIEVP